MLFLLNSQGLLIRPSQGLAGSKIPPSFHFLHRNAYYPPLPKPTPIPTPTQRFRVCQQVHLVGPLRLRQGTLRFQRHRSSKAMSPLTHLRPGEFTGTLHLGNESNSTTRFKHKPASSARRFIGYCFLTSSRHIAAARLEPGTSAARRSGHRITVRRRGNRHGRFRRR